MQFQTRKNFSRSELEQYPKQNTISHFPELVVDRKSANDPYIMKDDDD